MAKLCHCLRFLSFLKRRVSSYLLNLQGNYGFPGLLLSRPVLHVPQLLHRARTACKCVLPWIQITSEREPWNLLASSMQQIKRFLAQRGGANGETGDDELASCVLQYLTSVSWSTPSSVGEPSEHSGTANHRRMSRRFARWWPPAHGEGIWGSAQHMALIPMSSSNLASTSEMPAAWHKSSAEVSCALVVVPGE